MKNKKLKAIVEQLHDGACIDEMLNADQIALLGRLEYDEMYEAIDNHEDAQKLFWVVAQNLAGEQEDGYFPPIDAIYSKTDQQTPQACADEWNALSIEDKEFFDEALVKREVLA
jgi:hypothetical protein